MSTPVTFNGVSYSVPSYGNTGYAQGAGNLSAYLVAIASGTLQQSGGTFSLTADVNFGTNFGLISKYFTSITATPATAGIVRLAKTDSIDWRNNANSANLGLTINGSDQLTFNGSVLATGGGITQLTGDVTAGPGSGSQVATLANTAVTPGSYTNTALTVDAKGRITAASNGTAVVTSVSGTANQITSTGGTTPVLAIANPLTTPGPITSTGDIEAVLNPGSNNPARGMISTRFATDQSSAHFSGKKARGTLSSPLPVQALDYITALVPNPWDGFQYLIPGEAVWQVSPGSVVSNGVVPVDFVVQTGSGTPGDGVDRMRIGANGHVGINLGINAVDAFGTVSVTAFASTNAIRLNTSDAAFAALDVTSSGGANAINVAQGNLSFATSGNGIKGTVTNDNASTGIVGEFLTSAVTTATNFPATGTVAAATSISLTAGDWDVSGVLNNTGVVVTGTYYFMAITATSGSAGTQGTTQVNGTVNNSTTNGNSTIVIPMLRVSLAAPATYFLNVSASYSVGQPQYVGNISARRVR